MASFSEYNNILRKKEGGYIIDVDGETYEGILRKVFPNASVWAKIDKEKKKFPLNRIKDGTIFPYLRREVDLFFKMNFWNALKADHINNQSIANILVDFKINGGLNIANLQKFLGLASDGIIGRQTISAINAKNQKELFDWIFKERQKHYGKNSKRNSGKWNEGWENRLKSFVFNENVINSTLIILFLLAFSYFLVKK